jgi:hypothetical protein
MCGKESPAECLRNWTNATAGASATIIAVIAALIAFQQYRVAAVAAALPVVKERVLSLQALTKLVLDLHEILEQISHDLGSIVSAIDRNSIVDATHNAERLMRNWSSLNQSSGKMLDLQASSVREIDQDKFIDEYYKIIQRTITGIAPSLLHLQYFVKAEKSSDTRRLIAAGLNVRRDENAIRAAAEAAKLELNAAGQLGERLSTAIGNARSLYHQMVTGRSARPSRYDPE